MPNNFCTTSKVNLSMPESCNICKFVQCECLEPSGTFKLEIPAGTWTVYEDDMSVKVLTDEHFREFDKADFARLMGEQKVIPVKEVPLETQSLTRDHTDEDKN